MGAWLLLIGELRATAWAMLAIVDPAARALYSELPAATESHFDENVEASCDVKPKFAVNIGAGAFMNAAFGVMMIFAVCPLMVMVRSELVFVASSPCSVVTPFCVTRMSM